MKRTISLLLSLAIIMSLFGGIDMSVFATTTESKNSEIEPIDIDIYRAQCFAGIAYDPNTDAVEDCNAIYNYYIDEGIYSPTKSFLDAVYADEELMAEFALWQLESLGVDSSSIVDTPIQKKDYYESLITAIIAHEYAEDSPKTQDIAIQATGYSATIVDSLCNITDSADTLELVDKLDVNSPDTMKVLEQMFNEHPELGGFDVIDIILSASNTIMDAIEKIAAYSTMHSLDQETKDWLASMYNACDQNADAALKAALFNLMNASFSFTHAVLVDIKDTSFRLANWGIGATVNVGLSMLAATNPLTTAIMAGLKLGKTICDICFATSDICEQLFLLECMYDIQGLARIVTEDAKSRFVNSQTNENAKAFTYATHYYFESIINTDIDCMISFLDLLYNGGLLKGALTWVYGVTDDYQEAVDSLESLREVRQNNYDLMINLYKAALAINYKDTYDYYYTVDNTVPITSISFRETWLLPMEVGDFSNIYVQYEPSNTTQRAYIVTSDNPAVVEVHDNIITAVAKGTANLTISSIENPEISYTKKITVDAKSEDTGTETPKPEGSSSKFTYTVDDGEATITGLVEGYEPSNLTIPFNVDGHSVVGIGYSAFDNLEFLRRVSIHSGVSHIGTNAFYNCVNLSTVTLNNGLKSIGDDAFGNCKSLDSIVIPETVTYLGDCFNDCTGLRELTLPVSAKIYYYEFGYINTTFKNCTNIEKVILTKGSGIMQNFSNYTCTPWYISGCKEVIISEGVSNISYKAFYDCSSLEKVFLPNSVMQIDESAFYNCTNLQNITFPSELSSIGRNAFYNCTSIDTIVLPNSLLRISAGAFYGCTSVEQVIVGDNVSQIGNEAFYQCGAITELSLPASATYGSNTFSGCSNINQVTITAGNGQMHTYSDMISYGNTIFYQYSPWFISGCKKIIIDKGVTNISDFAFYNCTSVEHFELPNSLATIGNDSFRGCTNLKSIEIPDSVTCIGDHAFFYCPNLLDITFPKTLDELSPTAVSNTAFMSNSTNWTNGALYIADWLYATDEEYGGEYKIEPGTKTIGDGAFSYHDTVTKIHIPSSVERIQGTAIYSCTSLQEITVDSQNGFYSSENGMLFNKEKTELICCPNKKGVCSIPSGVIKIRDWAFSSCNSNLTELVIPISVMEIGYNAISRNSLQHIFYEGTENEWGSISGISNTFIQNSEKHYNYSVRIISVETCFNYGTKEFECTHCGYKKSETILPIGHSFANGTCCICGRLEEDCIESSHNYSNNSDDVWIVNKPNASYITVTFSASTETENHCDYIYIYDMYDNLIGQYSGKMLASQTITVPGNIIKIRLTSDGSVNKYGFAVTDICSYIKIAVNDVEVVMPENTIDLAAELRVDEIDIDNIVEILPGEFDFETAQVYDIYFEKDDKRVQPNGAVTVYVPVPRDVEGKKCKVFHIDESGSATDMNAFYENGYMVFTTEHFSYYALYVNNTVGDVDADGEISDWDAILLNRYLAGWAVEIDSSTADIDADGEVSDWDAIVLERYLAGWNVEITAN